jgi:hypothetical protein
MNTRLLAPFAVSPKSPLNSPDNSSTGQAHVKLLSPNRHQGNIQLPQEQAAR